MTRAPKEQKKKHKLDEFVAIAEAEELTRQKELDVAKVNAEPIKARIKVKAEQLWYKLQKLADRFARCKEQSDDKANKLQLLEMRKTSHHPFNLPFAQQTAYSESLLPSFMHHHLPQQSNFPHTGAYHCVPSPAFCVEDHDPTPSISNYDSNHTHHSCSQSLPFEDNHLG